MTHAFHLVEQTSLIVIAESQLIVASDSTPGNFIEFVFINLWVASYKLQHFSTEEPNNWMPDYWRVCMDGIEVWNAWRDSTLKSILRAHILGTRRWNLFSALHAVSWRTKSVNLTGQTSSSSELKNISEKISDFARYSACYLIVKTHRENLIDFIKFGQQYSMNILQFYSIAWAMFTMNSVCLLTNTASITQ